MKRILSITLPVVLLFLLACASGKTATSDTAKSDTERDGTSVEKAVIVNSINEEYEWIQKQYPGARVTMQALIERKGKYYDRLSFEYNGEKKEAYFDINKFFGKGF